MVRSANKFYIFICPGYTIWGYCFTDSYIISNMIDTLWGILGMNPEPGSSVGDGETGELIYFVLYYIMWPRAIRRNNRVSQCEKILQR